MTGEIITNNSLTVGTLVDHAFFLSDEEVGVVFDRSSVLRLLNLGFRRVLSVTGYPYKTAETDVTSGVREYPLMNPAPPASDSVRGADVEWADLLDGSNNLVASLSKVSYDRNESETGQPTDYSVVDGAIVLSPVPDADYVLRVSYRQEPDWLSESEYPPFSDEQAEAAVFYTVWQMKLKDDEAGIADRWKDNFDSAIDRIRSARTGVYKPEQVS